MSIYEFELFELKKSYSGKQALDGITLSIAKGSMNFLLGANGSGKSTLLKCLCGHQYWDSGTIHRRGKSRERDYKDFNLGLHLISEDISPPLASLKELREVYQTVYPNWDEVIFRRFLNLSGLDVSQNLTQVSRGQKIQLLIGLALATRPEVLLIDEATAVLDPYMRNRLIVEIESLNRQTGVTVIFATNLATELTALPGRLLIMQQGRVVVDRDSEHLRDGYVKVRVAAEDFEVARNAGFSLIDKNEDGTYSFIGTQALAEKLTNFKPDARMTSIEEIFIFHSERKSA